MALDHLSSTLSALADPTRRAILARLAQGESSVKELAQPFAMSLPAVSKHLKVLERAHLIERSREAQWRPCKLAPQPLKEVASWVEQYRKLWEERFDRLDVYLKEIQKGKPDAKAAPKNDLELTITRIFDAPRDLVFRMWSEPHHMQRWGCPDGFTSAEGRMDFREGGRWSAVMRSPDGKDLHLAGVYREIVKPARLVFTHAWLNESGQPDPETLITVDLTEQAGKTKMTFHQSGFVDKAERDGHESGWGESFEKLGAFIDVLKHSDREMVITRVIAAPIATVFAAFADSVNIGKWWGPNGFTTTTHEKDFRVGGVWRYTMHGPDGTDYPNYVTYTEIEKPARIAYEHGTNPQHPSEFKAEITLVAEGAATKVSLRMIIGNAAERERYVKFGAVEGGQQTLERLAAHLTTSERR